jgi:hypothetical protein
MTTIRNITDALATCQLPLPDSATHWTDISDALRTHHDAQTIEDPTNALETMTADSAGETVDRLTRQRLEVNQSQIVARQLIEGANARAARAAQAHADSIIAAARKQFDQAAKTIHDNANAYSPNDTHEDVLRRGAHAATVWAEITRASHTLDAVTHLWSTLYGTPPTLDAVVETYDGDHWRRMDGEALLGSANRWYVLVAAGYTLRLNTHREARALAAATPERTLRSEHTRRDGFIVHDQVRA